MKDRLELHVEGRLTLEIKLRVELFEDVLGQLNAADAAEGTIRKSYALSIGENSVHGSDAPETAAQEIAYWFSETEIVG